MVRDLAKATRDDGSKPISKKEALRRAQEKWEYDGGRPAPDPQAGEVKQPPGPTRMINPAERDFLPNPSRK